VRAVNAGVDLLLHATTEAASSAAYRVLTAARRAGRLEATVARAAVRRVSTLKRALT
jgi:hypothetical protein